MNWKKVGTRLGIVALLLLAYAAYWVLTPTPLEVSSIAADPTSQTSLLVTLHNPTGKWVTGTLGRIITSLNINPNTPQVLTSTADFPISIAPFAYQSFTVPMNSRVATGIDYILNLMIDGVGPQQITVTLS